MVIIALFCVMLLFDLWIEGKEEIDWPKETIKKKRYPQNTVAGFNPKNLERAAKKS